jgi:hypothetical protein
MQKIALTHAPRQDLYPGSSDFFYVECSKHPEEKTYT